MPSSAVLSNGTESCMVLTQIRRPCSDGKDLECLRWDVRQAVGSSNSSIHGSGLARCHEFLRIGLHAALKPVAYYASLSQADTITQAADDFGVSEEIDGEYKTTAAVAHTVQGMPGVMDAQSRAAHREGGQVAAKKKVEGAEKDAHEEQKWQSFMEKHFGTFFFVDTHGLRRHTRTAGSVL